MKWTHKAKGDPVKHFSDEEWLDFVRQVMPASQRALLETHLQSECPECVHLHRFWGNVHEVARREARSDVPTDVRALEAIFAQWRRMHVVPVKAKRARPIFDSLLQPIPAGVRTVARPSRRLLHRLGKWIVDLRLELEPGGLLSVTGQMLNSGWHPPEGTKLPVFLMSNGALVGETGANHFGEFQLTVPRSPDLTLFIDLPRRPAIAVVLPDPEQPYANKEE
jgi:hypothetical protein